MGSARLRFWLALAAFLLWLSYLGYLVYETRQNRVVLSRPQFLISTLDVIAEIDSPDTDKVLVKDVHWPPGHEDLVGKTISVINLAESKEDWIGPGEYILPLVTQGTSYRVAPLPRSPGFPAYTARPRIYPATPETRRQLQDMQKAVDQK
jgi:hypothetical protein